MERAKFHPLTLIALTFSSITMALYAYRSFSADETAFGVVFFLLCIFVLGLAIYGFVRNRRIGENGTHES